MCASQKDLNKASRPDSYYIVDLLKSCTTQKDLGKGSKLHTYVQEHKFLEENSFVTNALVSMYARCGALSKAQQVFQALPIRNVVTWTALMTGHAQQGQGEEALNCFVNMQQEGQTPNEVTFICALKACACIGTAAKGKEIHDKIVSLDLLEKSIVLGNALVDMYVRCGELSMAQQALKELPVRDVFSWTALIAGYAKQGQGQEALKCFDGMQQEGYFPNAVTFICALKACGNIGASAKGERIHDKVVSLGMLDKNIVIGNTLVDMYVRCGALAQAQQVFAGIPVRDVVSWTTLIAGYVQHGQGEEALKCFDTMQQEGHTADAFTFACALHACGSIGATDKGKQTYDKILSLDMLGKDTVLGNILVDMFAKCGALAMAQEVLEKLPIRDVVSWNALIAGYAQQGLGEDALKCFDNMHQEGHCPDVITYICALNACGSIGAAAKGKHIHDCIIDLGMLQKNIALGNALVDMYAKCGALAMAHQVFNRLPFRDVVTCNALIAGYAQHGQGEEALRCFDVMQLEGRFSDAVTFICALNACGSIGAAAKGKQIHDMIVSLGMLGENIVLGNALVSMYAKCGALTLAQEVLQEFSIWDVITWTALIAGYAEQGQGEEALKCFESMQSKRVEPNSITLVCVLNACSHSGLADKIEMLFSALSNKYGISSNPEHCCCMVDLLGRAGKFNKALNVIQEMPYTKSLPVWVALLCACQKWGEVKIGRIAFEHALHLDRRNCAIYICMVHIYTAAGMQEDADKIQALRVKNWI